jgi:hypothetical protein
VTSDNRDVYQDWFDGVRTRGIEVVREELGAVLDARASERLGTALADRHRLFRSINRRLESRGVRVSEPAALVVDKRVRDDIGRVLSEGELERLAELNAIVSEPTIEAAWKRAVDVVGRAIEVHEVQHRIDYALDPPLAIPDSLEQYVGPLADGDRPNKRAKRAMLEMSAYLAELARNDMTPRSSLVLISSFVFDRAHWGTAESYAMLGIYTELARALGIELSGSLVERRQIRRDVVARLFGEIMQRPPSELRSGARRAWEAAFARRFPEATLQPEP